jgi:Cys-rich four helix bundle protein (predicted Tat secretion target)
MNRRELLGASVATLGGAALLASTRATAAAARGSNADLVDTTSHCLKVGLECAAHCDEMLGMGNKDMAACRASVTDMLAACEALQRLAARGSKHTKAFAKNCAAICADCAKACEPHAKTMDVCKTCMDACKECEKACNAAA